jgi:hypothetical protein
VGSDQADHPHDPISIVGKNSARRVPEGSLMTQISFSIGMLLNLIQVLKGDDLVAMGK